MKFHFELNDKKFDYCQFEFDIYEKAALAGKQVLLQGLEQQSIDARQGLESEIQQLQQAKRSAKAAQQAAQQALNHVQGIIQNVVIQYCISFPKKLLTNIFQ